MWKLIGYGYFSGIYSKEQLIEAWNYNSCDLEFGELSTHYGITFYFFNAEDTYDSWTVYCKDLDHDIYYFDLRRDLILYIDPDKPFYERHDIIDSTYLDTFQNRDTWSYSVNKYGQNFSGFGFLDRLFTELSAEKFVLYSYGIRFMSECYEDAYDIVCNDNTSNQEKVDALYFRFYTNSEMTVFEKVDILYYCKDLSFEVYDNDLYGSAIIEGKTMDELIDSLRVENLSELDAVQQDSENLIENWRDSNESPEPEINN